MCATWHLGSMAAMITLGREYSHTSVRFGLSPGQLNQKMVKWPLRLGSPRSCIGLQGFIDFFSLETCVFFFRAVKIQGPSPSPPQRLWVYIRYQRLLSPSLSREEKGQVSRPSHINPESHHFMAPPLWCNHCARRGHLAHTLSPHER